MHGFRQLHLHPGNGFLEPWFNLEKMVNGLLFAGIGSGPKNIGDLHGSQRFRQTFQCLVDSTTLRINTIKHIPRPAMVRIDRHSLPRGHHNLHVSHVRWKPTSGLLSELRLPGRQSRIRECKHIETFSILVVAGHQAIRCADGDHQSCRRLPHRQKVSSNPQIFRNGGTRPIQVPVIEPFFTSELNPHVVRRFHIAKSGLNQVKSLRIFRFRNAAHVSKDGGG